MIAFNTLNSTQDRIDEWCENLTQSIKHGGHWGIPRSGLIFRFDQTNRTMTLVHGNPSDPDFIAAVENFGRIGWTVLE
jgi:hypothetical protein